MKSPCKGRGAEVDCIMLAFPKPLPVVNLTLFNDNRHEGTIPLTDLNE